MKTLKQIKDQEKLTVNMIYTLQNSLIGLMPESEEWKVIDRKLIEVHAQFRVIAWVLGNDAVKDV